MCGGCETGGWAIASDLPRTDCLVTVRFEDGSTAEATFSNGQFSVAGVVAWRLRIEPSS